MVFDRVVSATFENLGDFSPLVVDNSVHEEQNPLLFFIPVDFLNSGVEVIVPTLSALLANTAIQMLGNQRPLLGPVCHHQLQNTPVLLGGPCALHVERLAFSSDSLLGKMERVRLIAGGMNNGFWLLFLFRSRSKVGGKALIFHLSLIVNLSDCPPII